MDRWIRADWNHAVLGRFEGVRVLNSGTSDAGRYWKIWVPQQRTTYIAMDYEMEFVRE